MPCTEMKHSVKVYNRTVINQYRLQCASRRMSSGLRLLHCASRSTSLVLRYICRLLYVLPSDAFYLFALNSESWSEWSRGVETFRRERLERQRITTGIASGPALRGPLPAGSLGHLQPSNSCKLIQRRCTWKVSQLILLQR